MKITIDCVYERDMDMLFVRKLAQDKEFVRKFFLESKELAEKGYGTAEYDVLEVAHSVSTDDGESDIEAILSVNGKKIALLIEDKIDAPAQPEQAERYFTRGDKAVRRGDYAEFYVFIVAPKDYLDGNSEVKKYPNRIAYEDILSSIEDEFEKAMLERALSNANIVRLPRDKDVTAFWDQLYDYVDKKYPDVFKIHGHRGLERSGQAGQWITMSCCKPYCIEIKSDRGFVDLEIGGYGDKFAQFYDANKERIDKNKLFIRGASKSLAIRKYVNKIDFSRDFESQIPYLKEAFDAAKELQDLIPHLELK